MKNDQRGITLIELLGVLAILSVIILLVGSAHLFGQKQLVYQTDEVGKQSDVRLVVSQLTTDFRSITADNYEVIDDEYHIGEHTYSHNGTAVFRNGQKLSDHMAEFSLTPIDVDGELTGVNIVIESYPGEQSSPTKVETTIYFRR